MKRLLLAVAASLALLRGALGCAIPDPGATFTASCPDRASFTAVDGFLEIGCGTGIDCHGSPPPGPCASSDTDGLRLDAGSIPGGDTSVNRTTVAEVDAAWRSVCGLQPELMTQVVEGQLPPDALLLLQKPRMETHHKGNVVIVPGDDGDTCITKLALRPRRLHRVRERGAGPAALPLRRRLRRRFHVRRRRRGRCAGACSAAGTHPFPACP